MTRRKPQPVAPQPTARNRRGPGSTPLGVRRSPDLDATDFQIVDLLINDGRLSNRAIAAATSLTEATVASRLKNLIQNNLFGVTCLIDWKAAGYQVDMWFCANVTSRSLRLILSDLSQIEGVRSAHTVFGRYDLIVHALLEDERDARTFIAERLASLRGLTEITSAMSLEVFKFNSHNNQLPAAAAPLSLPAPAFAVDALDGQIISALCADGRQSNREIARQLQVSEGTVRVRLGRLEADGLIRISGQSDSFKMGVDRTMAYLGIRVERGFLVKVCERLTELADVHMVAMTAGQFDIIATVSADSRRHLVELIVDDIRSIAGLLSTETWEVVESVTRMNQYTRLL